MYIDNVLRWSGLKATLKYAIFWMQIFKNIYTLKINIFFYISSSIGAECLDHTSFLRKLLLKIETITIICVFGIEI